jgi:hypothetical protein
MQTDILLIWPDNKLDLTGFRVETVIRTIKILEKKEN